MPVAPLLLVLLAVPLLLWLGRWRPAITPWLAALTAAGALLLLLAAVGSEPVRWAWATTLDLYLAFHLDGIASLYGAVAAGVGLLIVVYAAGYMPHHLHEQQRALAEQVPFYAWLLLFLAAMLGLVTADDLLLLFVFFDLTAICSYFLIGYDRAYSAQARTAALMALLVTGVTSVAMLAGILLLYAEYGTLAISELASRVQAGVRLDTALALIALAALAKSAQVPLHFWLPRAMAAPTPVSAYLHSAAMVAAGVFVLHRLHPLLELSETVRLGLFVVALLSILIGGLLAIAADELKRILAYSTVAQYGYVTLLLALGGAQGAAAAAYYVLVHALCKSALFMTAGAVTQVTGRKRLSELGGLARPLPGLALVSGIAAAGLAGLPLTAGFFKDELLFKLATEQGLWLQVIAVLAAASTLIYTVRFWVGLFLGPPKRRAEPLPGLLLAPIAALALLTLAGGIIVDPAVKWADHAGSELHHQAAELHAGYKLALTPENLMALAAYALGALLLAARALQPLLARGLRRLDVVGADRAYRLLLHTLNALSHRLHGLEVRDLRDRLAGVFIPAGLLIAAGLIWGPQGERYGVIGFGDATPHLVVALAAVMLVSLLSVRQRRHLGLILTMTGVGLGLAVVFALLGAPDVALVAVLVETTLTLLFIATLALLPEESLRRERRRASILHGGWWRTLAGFAAGGLVFVVAWATLSEPGAELVPERFRQLSESAHAKNIVAAILADFRGLDTLGEATVLFVALLATISLLRTVRRRS